MEDTTTTTQTPVGTGEATTETTTDTTVENTETTETPTGDVAEGASTPEPTTGEGGEQGDVDYQTKFGESTRENQRLMNFIKEQGYDPKTLEKKVDTTSDEYLSQVIDGFEFYPEDKKNEIRGDAKLNKSMKELLEFKAKYEDKERFNMELDSLKSDEAYKGIFEGSNEEKFRAMAYSDEYRNAPLSLVAKAFMYDNAQTGAAKPAPRKGGENPGGGVKTPANAGGKVELTSAQAKEMRITKPREYQKLVVSKKLVITD